MLTTVDEEWLREVAAKMDTLNKRVVVENAQYSRRSHRLERVFTNLAESTWRILGAAESLHDELEALKPSEAVPHAE